jgi:hypothetical protein
MLSVVATETATATAAIVSAARAVLTMERLMETLMETPIAKWHCHKPVLRVETIVAFLLESCAV